MQRTLRRWMRNRLSRAGVLCLSLSVGLAIADDHSTPYNFKTIAYAVDISGTISSTLTITENSRLVSNVTCTVSGAPCIVIGASNVVLDLNGYTITGLGDPQTGCSGTSIASEVGILVNKFNNVTIRGLGIVQQFRNFGIQLLTSSGATVTGVTSATNCTSGIIVAAARIMFWRITRRFETERWARPAAAYDSRARLATGSVRTG